MLLYSIQCLHFLYFPFYINGSLGSGNSLPLFLWSFILFYLPFTPYRAPVHWVLELLGRSSLFFSHASFCCHFLIFWKKICHLIFNFKELPSFLPPLYNTMLVTWMHPLWGFCSGPYTVPCFLHSFSLQVVLASLVHVEAFPKGLVILACLFTIKERHWKARVVSYPIRSMFILCGLGLQISVKWF